MLPTCDANAPAPPVYVVHGEGGMGTMRTIEPAFTVLLSSVGDANTKAFAREVGVDLLTP